jgi:hypothetical protein|nr:MAG TPA: hypothetical protein [Caudoviricetes sp.]
MSKGKAKLRAEKALQGKAWTGEGVARRCKVQQWQ